MSADHHDGCCPGHAERENIRVMMARRVLFLVGSAALMVLLFLYSLTIGAADLSISEVYRTVLNRYFPGVFEVSDRSETIVWSLRMPRVAIAAIAGVTLGMAGCVTQAILRNPLATPYTLGVSAGAGFGAAVGFIVGAGIFSGMAMVIGNSFIFALIPAFVILLASRRMGVTPETLILCGVAMAYIFGASNTLLQFFADDEALRSAVFWLVGDLTRASLWQVPYISVALVLFLGVSMYYAKDINIIKMGDDDAKGMGVDVERVKLIMVLSACLATATVICFTGAIGFICLLAPHISRLFIGGDERYLIPASGLFGACLLLAADIVAKTAVAPVLLPVGAITALLGGPMLIYLLLRRRRDCCR